MGGNYIMYLSIKKYRQYRQDMTKDIEIPCIIPVDITSEMAIVRDEEISSDENYWEYLFQMGVEYMEEEK